MEKILKEWKKVLETDLVYICSEVESEIERPAVIFLEGKVGAGKTTFAQYFSGNRTMSPTYSILNEVGAMLHGDFYRLEDSQEIIHLDLSAQLEGKEIFLAEWGWKYLPVLIQYIPDNFHYYRLLINDEIEGNSSPNLRNFKLYFVNPLV